MMEADSTQIPYFKKLAYAAPAFALAIVGIPIYVYVPKFYTDIMGVDIVLMGVLLFSVRIFDAITDPLLGRISDHTQTPFGRRRPYILVGAFLVALAMLMLFNPPDTNARFITSWFGISIYALFLFWTTVTVAYEALGPEITFDYNERTTLFAIRDGALIAGTLMAAASPALVQWLFALPEDFSGQRATFRWISIIYTPLLIGTSLWCVFAIKESSRNHRIKTKTSILADLKTTSQNRPFIILLSAYTISAIGNNLPATLILYYVQYVLESSRAELFLLLYFLMGILFLPVWLRIARRIDKKKAWLLSMAINTGAFAGVFFLGPGDIWPYTVLVCLSGIGFGATLALPSSIQADVIDYDELLTGHRREGQYMGLWGISKKLAAAAGVGAALTILGWSGYEPNIAQSDRVVFTLKALYAAVPSLFNLIALFVAMAYPIDNQSHQAIRQAIKTRKLGEPFQDPLKPNQSKAKQFLPAKGDKKWKPSP